MQRHASQAGGRTGRHAEEINKSALRLSHVGVHQNADRLTALHGSQQTAGKVSFAERAVAVESTVAVHQRIHVGIVQRAHDYVHGMAIERVRERADLPSSEMRCQIDDAFAARIGFGKVLEAFVDRYLRNILFGIAWKQGELSQLPSQSLKKTAQD